MNFFKDPKYKSIRVILLLVIIIGAGWFVVGNMNQSDSNQGLVVNRASGWLVSAVDGGCTVDIGGGIYVQSGGNAIGVITTVNTDTGSYMGCVIGGEVYINGKTAPIPVTVNSAGQVINKSTGKVIGTTVKPKTSATPNQ